MPCFISTIIIEYLNCNSHECGTHSLIIDFSTPKNAIENISKTFDYFKSINSETEIQKKLQLKRVLTQELQIDDKVKKQIFVGCTEPGKKRTQWSEFIYGKVIYIENGYASVKYKHHQIPEMEKISDLTYVSEEEWKSCDN